MCLKEKLVDGLFGMDSEGDLFVVVGNRLVYQSGGFDWRVSVNDNLKFESGRSIDALYEANCFGECNYPEWREIWNRHKPVEMTLEEIEEKLGIENIKIITTKGK